MINISDKQECCGCSACAERCPRQCIKMVADEEGFLYPEVDENSCIHCDLCNTVCPILNQYDPVQPIRVYAAQHKNEYILKHSSSGGVFTALAENVIREGGVVFGACFDKNWKVIHSYTESMEGLAGFRGSKYVQSCMGSSYQDVEKFLKQERKVLFSGTPCQIAGLKRFLRKEYGNLQTVDVICHGVPSPLVWERYVETLRPKGATGENSVSSLKKKPVITGLCFRDKRAGWRKFGFSAWVGATEGSDENTVFPPKHQKRIRYEILQQNIFLRGFLQNLYLRPSCHQCHFRNFRSGSDATIADFWGVKKAFPNYAEDKGLSLVVKKSDSINLISSSLEIKEIECPINNALSGNSSAYFDDKPNINRNIFWNQFLSNPIKLENHIINNTTYSSKQKFRDWLDCVFLDFHIYNFVKRFVVKYRNYTK